MFNIFQISILLSSWLRKPSLLLLSFLLIPYYTIAQNDSINAKKNTVYLDVGGLGGYGSLNYERTLLKYSQFTISARIGLSTIHLKNHLRKISPDLIIPFSLYFCYGNSHKIEFGLGETYTNVSVVNFENYKAKRNSYFHSGISLGYRYQPTKGCLFSRLAYTAIIEQNTAYKHWGSISLGYTF